MDDNKKSSKFIEDIIMEASLDARISSGVIDMENTEHIQVIAEAIYNKCGDEAVVDEFVNAFVDEGRYPERQAYNKDGWLVTFPSQEYRNAAIKKGTHFVFDPTHGKGGMNLYYRKKGKQRIRFSEPNTITKSVNGTEKQSTQPGRSIVSVPSPKKQAEPRDIEKQQITQTVPKKAEKPIETPSSNKSSSTKHDQRHEKDSDSTISNAVLTPSPLHKEKSGSNMSALDDTSVEKTTPISSEPMPIERPSVRSPDYTEFSKKFASNKRWNPTSFGEYRDVDGNTMAVVGLSGEIVPIKNTDREEYKLFVEKSMF